MDVAGPRHRGLTIFTCSINWELKGGMGSMAYTNSVPDQHALYPVGQHTFAFFTKCARVRSTATCGNQLLQSNANVPHLLPQLGFKKKA